MTEANYKLAERVITNAADKSLTIATAESCTGGWIGKILTDVPGSSRVLKGGLIAYSNEIKEQLLGVPESLLIQHGAVSRPVALEMAKNCAQCFDVDIALSVTGIAGPGGGSAEKPVGLVFMALHSRGETSAYEFRFDNNGRDGVRRSAVKQALELILENIR